MADEYSITDGYGETQVELREKWRIGISATISRDNLPKLLYTQKNILNKVC